MDMRRAEISDLEALETVRRDAILGLAAAAMPVEAAAEWAAGGAADRIAQAIREYEVWVAVDDAVIGWVEVRQDRVAALYVSPLFSGRGVGSSLLCLAEQIIAAAGYATARLEASQNALGFYLRKGYLQSGPRLPDGSSPMTKRAAASLGAPLRQTDSSSG
jgi:putative acetyltransferase